jgi:hypothetical protein
MRSLRTVRAAVVALALAAPLGAPTVSAGDIVTRRDGSKAVYVPPPPPASPNTAGGFQLDDAGVGAAGMLVLVVGVAGVMSLRGRRPSARPVGRVEAS